MKVFRQMSVWRQDGLRAIGLLLAMGVNCHVINKKKMQMVRQAKLSRANRVKGICTAKKTTCR